MRKYTATAPPAAMILRLTHQRPVNRFPFGLMSRLGRRYTVSTGTPYAANTASRVATRKPWSMACAMSNRSNGSV